MRRGKVKHRNKETGTQKMEKSKSVERGETENVEGKYIKLYRLERNVRGENMKHRNMTTRTEKLNEKLIAQKEEK